MPLTEFICPDGEKIPIGNCLVSCRMNHRCLTLPTLMQIITGDRPWDGTPSTTRLLNGTMQEWLKATKPYAAKPQNYAYALLGNEHHAKLERAAGGVTTVTSETRIGTTIRSTPDILEPDEIFPGCFVITDYKTFGSYRVMKILGLEKHEGFSDTDVYKSSGKWGKAGSPKRITTWVVNPTKVDMYQEQMQLNHYRLQLSDQGYPITRMQLQITVRDGNTQSARGRGITEPIYLVPIPTLDDQWLRDFFEEKRRMLVAAMSGEQKPPVCNDQESWEGRRCQDFCDVAHHCSKGQIEQAKKKR